MKQLSLQINNMLWEYFDGIWKNRMFFCYALIVCIVSFGYELFHYTWGVDDEIFEIMKGPAYWWATQGRFSSGYLLGLFFGNLCVPFFSLFFSQLCMLVAYYLFFIGKEEVNGFKHYIGVSLFLSNPVLFYAYTFNCLTPITGLGFLLSAAAVILFEKRNWISIACGLLCAVFAIGCYQVFLFAIALFLSFNLIKKLETAEKLRNFVIESVWHFLFLAGCYGAYSAVFKLILFCTQSKMSPYIANMQDMNVKSWSHLFYAMQVILSKIGDFYSGKAVVYSEPVSMLLPLMILVLLLFFYYEIFKKSLRNWWKNILYVILVAEILVVPFVFFFLSIGRILLVLRTTLPIVLILPFFFTKVWDHANLKLRFVLGVIACICLLQFWYVNSKFSYTCYLQEKQDEQIVQNILNYILPRSKWPQESTMLYVHGSWGGFFIEDQFITGRVSNKHTKSQAESFEIEKKRQKKTELFFPNVCNEIGLSVFVNPCHRLIPLLKRKLYPNFKFLPPAQYYLVEQEVLQMPCYPESGSIKLVNGIWVIKLTNPGFEELKIFKKYAKIKNIILSKSNAEDVYLTGFESSGAEKILWRGEAKNLSSPNAKLVFKKPASVKVNASVQDPILNLNALPETNAKEVCLKIKCTSPEDSAFRLLFCTPGSGKSRRDKWGEIVIDVNQGSNQIAIVLPARCLKAKFLQLQASLPPGKYIRLEELIMVEYTKKACYRNFSRVLSRSNANGVELIRPNDPGIQKNIWYANENTLDAKNADIIFRNNFTFKTLAQNNDPILTFKNLPDAKTEKVCLRIRCLMSEESALQLYFYVPGSLPNKKLWGRLTLRGNKGLNDIAITLPAEYLKYKFLRFDPGAAVGVAVDFKNLCISEYQKVKE